MKKLILYISLVSILSTSIAPAYAESQKPATMWQQINEAGQVVAELSKTFGFRSSGNADVSFSEALNVLVSGGGITLFNRKQPGKEIHFFRKFSSNVNDRYNIGYQVEEVSNGVRKKMGILDLKWTDTSVNSPLPMISNVQSQWLVPKENVTNKKDCIVNTETLQYIGEDVFLALKVQLAAAAIFAIPVSILGMLLIGKTKHSAKFTMIYFVSAGLAMGFLLSFVGHDSLATVKYCY